MKIKGPRDIDFTLTPNENTPLRNCFLDEV